MKLIYFRCYCKDCDNPNGRNYKTKRKSKRTEESEPGFAKELTRVTDMAFYGNLGLQVIQPQWGLAESLLLFLLLDRKVLKLDLKPSNIGRLHKEFNALIVSEDMS